MIGGVTCHMLPHLHGVPHLHVNGLLDDTVQDDPREAEEVGCLRQLCLFYSCFTIYF